MFSKHRLNLQNIALNLPVLQRNMFSPLPLVSVSKKVAENEFLIFVGKCALPKYDLYVPQTWNLQRETWKIIWFTHWNKDLKITSPFGEKIVL